MLIEYEVYKGFFFFHVYLTETKAPTRQVPHVVSEGSNDNKCKGQIS